MPVIIWIVGFIVLLPVLAYAWWVFHALKLKRWRLVGLQLATPILLLLLGYGAMRWMDYRESLQYWEGVFGEGARVDNPLYAYYGERAFNGDGACAEAFALPQSVVSRLPELTTPAFRGYPRRPSYREHWRQIDWRKGPVAKEHQKYIDIALWAVRQAKDHEPKFGRIEQLLKSPDCIYALFHNSRDDWVGDVDLFIIDPEQGCFYLVNLNT